MSSGLLDLLLDWAFWSFIVTASLLVIAVVRAVIWDITDRIRLAFRRISARQKGSSAKR